MELLLELGVLVMVLTLLVSGLAAWRIGQVVSWRALAMTAWATRSFTDCVSFIRFCAEERDRMSEDQPRGRHVVWQPVEFRHSLDKWHHVS